MICQRCTRFLSHRIFPPPSLRGLSTSTVLAHPNEPPPVKSTSAAQPFSTPFTPSPSETPGGPPDERSKVSGGASRRSSVAAGTPLQGLGYIKGQELPLAKEDEDYPEWLWGLLDSGKKGDDTVIAVGDAYAKSKKQRRLAAKAARALKARSANEVAQIPLEEQSIDLPAGMGPQETMEAQEARKELTLAMRKARKKKIIESNYLRGMN
ncbi:hypothetical protein N7G274_010148 [Stereocaulon virgatum]|uniref:Large ribosomal subunit protein mL54 n=1 Tax=Stereocaulon virgatum TaxID=373712 RepID=A0ABR3ZU99_9LECA